MPGRHSRAPERAGVALAAVAVAIVAGATLMLAPAHRPASPPRGAGAVVLTTTAPPAQATRSGVPAQPPHGAGSAARAFVHDYLAALADPAMARGVRFATHDLRRRIASAGVHLASAGPPRLGRVVLLMRTRDLVVVHAAGAVGGVRQRVRFLMARTPGGWRVDDIDEPETP